MTEINRIIPLGLAIGTLIVTMVGAFYGTSALGLASITGGALALGAALLTRQQVEEKRLKQELAMGKSELAIG